MKTFYDMIRLMEAESEGLGDKTGDQPMPQEQEPVMPEQPLVSSKPKNYMFFSNLKVIKQRAEQILAMDASQVDALISDGHDWAADHISTSKDDVEEVCNWLVGEMEEAGSVDLAAGLEDASPEQPSM